MVFMLLGTFAHLTDTESALQCLRSVHAALKPGGLLVLELAHPSDAFDGSLMQEDTWNGEDAVFKGEGVPGELAVQYGKPGDHFDAIQQVIPQYLTIAASVALSMSCFAYSHVTFSESAVIPCRCWSAALSFCRVMPLEIFRKSSKRLSCKEFLPIRKCYCLLQLLVSPC